MGTPDHLDVSYPTDPDALPLALFDLDGTLTDPTNGIMTSHRWALNKLGIEPDATVDPADVIAATADEAHALLGVPPERIAESTALYRERFAISGWLEDTLYDGIGELMERLHSAGWLLGVASMKLEQLTPRILERVGIADYFDVVAGSDPKRARTNKRTIIEHALGRLDGAPRGVAMIGDRRHDIEAARSLQMTSIGAGWGFGTIEELVTANAHAIAVEPLNVADFLLGHPENDPH